MVLLSTAAWLAAVGLGVRQCMFQQRIKSQMLRQLMLSTVSPSAAGSQDTKGRSKCQLLNMGSLRWGPG